MPGKRKQVQEKKKSKKFKKQTKSHLEGKAKKRIERSKVYNKITAE